MRSPSRVPGSTQRGLEIDQRHGSEQVQRDVRLVGAGALESARAAQVPASSGGDGGEAADRFGHELVREARPGAVSGDVQQIGRHRHVRPLERLFERNVEGSGGHLQ